MVRELLVSLPSLTDISPISVAFAFSVICIFILVGLVEGVRRFGREYDRRIVALSRLQSKDSDSE
jgi:copper transporter 1